MNRVEKSFKFPTQRTALCGPSAHLFPSFALQVSSRRRNRDLDLHSGFFAIS